MIIVVTLFNPNNRPFFVANKRTRIVTDRVKKITLTYHNFSSLSGYPLIFFFLLYAMTTGLSALSEQSIMEEKTGWLNYTIQKTGLYRRR